MIYSPADWEIIILSFAVYAHISFLNVIEINIDYILMLVKKYHEDHCQDKEVLVTIRKAVEASPQLRSKKQLIEAFIANVNDVEDVTGEWNQFVEQKREEDLAQIIREEKLKDKETRRFMETAFREGEVKTVGTDLDKIMPPVSRFGGGGREKKKQAIIDKLKAFFEKYSGIGSNRYTAEPVNVASYDSGRLPVSMAAEPSVAYGEKKGDGQ